jgi:hypothetical protein
MMYREIWFRGDFDSDQNCFLVGGIPDWLADKIVDALQAEFPGYDWWVE